MSLLVVYRLLRFVLLIGCSKKKPHDIPTMVGIFWYHLDFCLLNLYVSVGKVIVDGRVVNKAGTQVSDKSVIEIKAEIPKYVCRWCSN